MLTHCENAGLVFETMKESIPDLLMFFVQRRRKPVLKTASVKQLLRIIWEAGFGLDPRLAQIKLFSILLLIVY